MRIFYGYERKPEDAPDGCEATYLDDATTNREGRHDALSMINDADHEDVFVVLDRADLGKGREIPQIIELIESRNATLSVEPPEGDAPAPRGRPRKFDPDPQQSAKIERLYRSGLVMRYVLEQASKEMGWPVKPHHLKRRYGNRWST